MTLVTLLVITLLLVAVVLTGPLASAVGEQFGVGTTALRAWDIAKWPVIAVVMSLIISGLYYIAPNVKPPGWRWLTPGALLALVTFAATSGGFALYIDNFNSNNNTYGALGGIVTFLVWAWLTNIALLLGVELDSEIERERQLTAQTPGAQERIQLPLRQE